MGGGIWLALTPALAQIRALLELGQHGALVELDADLRVCVGADPRLASIPCSRRRKAERAISWM
jgi:hypothetical protein